MERRGIGGDDNDRVVNAPFLALLEFEQWCSEFSYRCEEVGWKDTIVQLINLDGTKYLKISRSVAADPRNSDSPYQSEGELSDGEADEIREDDEESADCTKPVTKLSVEYSMILSPTYCVPILYFSLRDGSNPGPPSIDRVFQYLVPKSLQSVIANIGIMGGVSLVNHPITDEVCFCIHPCNTAQALKDVIGTRSVALSEYFQIWFGLIASSVGLYLPKELVITVRE